jgi:hypothetical protein
MRESVRIENGQFAPAISRNPWANSLIYLQSVANYGPAIMRNAPMRAANFGGLLTEL